MAVAVLLFENLCIIKLFLSLIILLYGNATLLILDSWASEYFLSLRQRTYLNINLCAHL